MWAEKVEIIKDVPGIFQENPKHNANATMYPTLTYQEALDIVIAGAKILHARCIQLAAKNGLPLHVRTFNQVEAKFACGTLIYDNSKERSPHPLYEEV